MTAEVDNGATRDMSDKGDSAIGQMLGGVNFSLAEQDALQIFNTKGRASNCPKPDCVRLYEVKGRKDQTIAVLRADPPRLAPTKSHEIFSRHPDCKECKFTDGNENLQVIVVQHSDGENTIRAEFIPR